MTRIVADGLAAWRGPLAALWREAFGDGPAFTGAFLDFAAGLGALRVSVVDGAAASMAAALPVGIALEDGRVLPALYLYGLCTVARLRGRGHARGLVESICEEAESGGCAAVVTQPASPSLAAWYGGLGFARDGASPPGRPVGGGPRRQGAIAKIGAADYLALREAALRGRRHVVYGEAFLKFQEWDCARGGGGFRRLPDGTLEAVEMAGGVPRLLERLCPGAASEGAAPAVAPMVRWLRGAPAGAFAGGAGWMPFTLG